jgi:hypothetical protein
LNQEFLPGGEETKEMKPVEIEDSERLVTKKDLDLAMHRLNGLLLAQSALILGVVYLIVHWKL